MLALSWSGETEELKDLINYSRRFRIPLIAVTVSADSTLGKSADVVLALPATREACPHNLAPTTSSLMQLALGDALAIALLESKGFSAMDFGVFHPGGQLGAALKFVRNVMHPGAAVPLIKRGAPMSEAIVEMSAKGFGCVAVIDDSGKLAGVITDGDLRRHMRADLLQAPVDEIMTASPKVVRPDQLVSEALQLLNSSKITALVVVETRPAGRHRAFPRSAARRRGMRLRAARARRLVQAAARDRPCHHRSAVRRQRAQEQPAHLPWRWRQQASPVRSRLADAQRSRRSLVRPAAAACPRASRRPNAANDRTQSRQRSPHDPSNKPRPSTINATESRLTIMPAAGFGLDLLVQAIWRCAAFVAGL